MEQLAFRLWSVLDHGRAQDMGQRRCPDLCIPLLENQGNDSLGLELPSPSPGLRGWGGLLPSFVFWGHSQRNALYIFIVSSCLNLAPELVFGATDVISLRCNYRHNVFGHGEQWAFPWRNFFMQFWHFFHLQRQHYPTYNITILFAA